MNQFSLALSGILATLVVLEVALRLLFGFGNPLTYRADSQIGYLIAPNQKTRRFGKQIAINQYSMRSPEITAARPANTLRILMLGDSIINGGWWTDQNETVSTLLQQQLAHSKAQPIEVLNASANSWSPRNQLAYLQRFGSFQSQILVLVINTDDLFGTAPSSRVVGHDPNYPAHKPPLALIEVISRYWLKPQPLPPVSEAGDRVGINLAAIQQIQEIAIQNNAKFMLLMTPLKRELHNLELRDYEHKARQRLQSFAEAQQITYIDFLPIFNALPDPASLYRDHIHLNRAGNQQVVQQIVTQINNPKDNQMVNISTQKH